MRANSTAGTTNKNYVMLQQPPMQSFLDPSHSLPPGYPIKTNSSMNIRSCGRNSQDNLPINVMMHSTAATMATNNGSIDAIPVVTNNHHKSMWAVNPLYATISVFTDDSDINYRTRSLPAWGKATNKPRPESTYDDLEELYAKVNFNKKRKNRMRNDEAAIIALCRSRSQNLQRMPSLERDGVVVYNERTAL